MFFRNNSSFSPFCVCLVPRPTHVVGIETEDAGCSAQEEANLHHPVSERVLTVVYLCCYRCCWACFRANNGWPFVRTLPTYSSSRLCAKHGTKGNMLTGLLWSRSRRDTFLNLR